MKQFDPWMMLAVAQEMLGGLLWPLLFSAFLLGAFLLWLLVRDRGIRRGNARLAGLLALPAGLAAIWLIFVISNSALMDIGGPIDWFVMLLIWSAGAASAALVAYVVLTVWKPRHG